MHGLWRNGWAALLAMALFVVVRPSAAAMMHHYDLTSLALQADSVVRGHVVGTKKVDQYTTVNTIEVVRSYKGPLGAGAKVDLSYDLYGMHPRYGFEPSDAGVDHTLGKDLVFFLKRTELAPYELQRMREAGVEAPQTFQWYVVSSGLRIFLGGKAQRFEQWNNPGGFEPVPQGHDPFDLVGDPRGGEALDLPGLEAEVAAAIAKADEVQRVLAAPDAPARRERIVALAGPDPADRPLGGGGGGFYQNEVAMRLVRETAKWGDLRFTLRAMSRAYGISTFSLSHMYPVEPVLAAAADVKLPRELRIAALDLLEGMWAPLRDAKDADARINALMSDPEASVRAAALEVVPTEKATVARRQTIKKRFEVERDDGVRIALYEAARRAEMLPELRSFPLILHAKVHGDVLSIAWADPAGGRNWAVSDKTVVRLVSASGPELASVFGPHTSYSNGAQASLQTRLARGPHPRATGPVSVALDLVLEDVGKVAPPVKRTFNLGAFEPPVLRETSAPPRPLPAAPAAEDAGAAESHTASVAEAGTEPSLPVSRARGCGCSAEGSDLPPLLPFAAAALVFLRAARRGRPSARRPA